MERATGYATVGFSGEAGAIAATGETGVGKTHYIDLEFMLQVLGFCQNCYRGDEQNQGEKKSFWILCTNSRSW